MVAAATARAISALEQIGGVRQRESAPIVSDGAKASGGSTAPPGSRGAPGAGAGARERTPGGWRCCGGCGGCWCCLGCGCGRGRGSGSGSGSDGAAVRSCRWRSPAAAPEFGPPAQRGSGSSSDRRSAICARVCASALRLRARASPSGMPVYGRPQKCSDHHKPQLTSRYSDDVPRDCAADTALPPCAPSPEGQLTNLLARIRRSNTWPSLRGRLLVVSTWRH